MFKDSVDTDTKRKEITWIAILCLAVLALWQILASYLGKSADFSPRTYEEKVLFGGMGAVLLCSVVYIAVREREQRLANQRLLGDLRAAVSTLNDRLRQLRSLCVTSENLVGTLDGDHVCQMIIDTLASQLRPSKCTLTIVTARRGQQIFTTSTGATADTSANDTESTAVPTLSTPIQIGSAVIGEITVNRAPGSADFTSEESSILGTLANMASKALESAILHEELQETYLSTLGALMNLLGARDNYAAAHARRVSSLSVRFGQYLGLSEEMIATLEEYSLLHDIGKIGIPDEILLKSSPLTHSERAVCEQHPIVGEQILRPLHPASLALEIVRNHHERWDGNGYPDKLLGESIPLLARLTHIIDAYDAILTERPYSPGHGVQSTLSEIQMGSGTQFDPQLVSAFVEMIREEEILETDILEMSSREG